MSEKSIIDIPVYVCSREEYENFLEQQSESIRMDYVSDKQVLDQKNYLRKKYGGWEFNRICGYLRIYKVGTQIRAEPYLSNKSRLYKHCNPPIINSTLGKEFVLDVKGEMSSQEIGHAITKELLELNKSKSYKRRYIDIEYFNKVSQYISWRDFISNDS